MKQVSNGSSGSVHRPFPESDDKTAAGAAQAATASPERASGSSLVNETDLAVAQSPGSPSETWKSIPGWPEYEVSDLGRVKRVVPGRGTQAGRIHAQCRDREGRVVVNLSHRGVRRQFKIHRLVMLAFVGPCPEEMEVAHLNGCPSDNRISNLIYATHLENNSHKVLHGTQARGETTPVAKLTAEQVRWVRENKGRISQAKMAAMLGVRPSTIASIAIGRNWRHVA